MPFRSNSRADRDDGSVGGAPTTAVDSCRFPERRQRADHAYRETLRIALDREVTRLSIRGLYCVESGSEIHVFLGAIRVDAVPFAGDPAGALRSWNDRQERVGHVVNAALSRLVGLGR